MKNILTLLVLFMAFVSCEKPITSADDTDTNKAVSPDDNLVVRVPIDGLSSSRLNFAVYDQDGTRVKQVNQQIPLSRTASFQLAPQRRSSPPSCAASFQLAPLRRSSPLSRTASFQLAPLRRSSPPSCAASFQLAPQRRSSPPSCTASFQLAPQRRSSPPSCTASFQLAPQRRSSLLSRTASFQLAPLRRSSPPSCAASFQLAPGSYFLVVVAHSSDGNPTMTNPRKIQFTNAQGFTDTFLYSEYITIADERKELNVTPKRIASLCRFVLTDDYPADVAKMRFYYTGGSGAFDATTGLGCVNSRQSQVFNITDGRKTFDLYTFLHDTEGTIHLTVSALDVSDVELTRREFDVPMKQNRITSMTGSYFTGSISISSLTIDTDWDPEYPLSF